MAQCRLRAEDEAAGDEEVVARALALPAVRAVKPMAMLRRTASPPRPPRRQERDRRPLAPRKPHAALLPRQSEQAEAVGAEGLCQQPRAPAEHRPAAVSRIGLATA